MGCRRGWLQAAARPPTRSCQQSGARARKNRPFRGDWGLGRPALPAHPAPEPGTSAWIPEALQCPLQGRDQRPHRPVLLAWAVLATPPSCLLRGHMGSWRKSGPGATPRKEPSAAGSSSLRLTRRCRRKGSCSQGTRAPTRARTHHTTRVHTRKAQAATHSRARVCAATHACTRMCVALLLLPLPPPPLRRCGRSGLGEGRTARHPASPAALPW